jgi:glycosyltransferase involved in cell wall biosynthesis
MRRVEVTHVAPSAFGAAGFWGGGERYPLGLAHAMSEHVPTRLIVFGTRARRSRLGRLEICELPVRLRWHGDTVNPLSERLALYVPLTRRLHLHQYHSVLTNALVIAGRATRRDVFVTDHGGAAYNYAGRFGLHRWVTGFLPVSAFSGSFFPELAACASPPILGGADPGRFHPGPEPRERRLVYVGRLLPHKGIDVLLRALDADTPLDIYGHSYDPAYRSHLTALAAGKPVRFHDSASDDEIARAYRTARVAVLPSVHRSYEGAEHPYPELLGLTLVEAMASGTPVIATRVGGLPEIVRDGHNGFLVEPGDTASLGRRVRQLLDDGAAWEAMSSNARACFLSHLTWERVAVRCLEAYGRLAG